ncbi:Wadjet anti-phage system protein JetD domain-containing protein [Pseudarthrobacter sp. So.54]
MGHRVAPSRAALSRLTAEESALYAALGRNRFGTSVRLEQELIRWDWALEQLSSANLNANRLSRTGPQLR